MSEPVHLCFTTDGVWAACPCELCEADKLRESMITVLNKIAWGDHDGSVRRIARDALEILMVCSACGGELQFADRDELGQWLVCEDCDYEVQA